MKVDAAVELLKRIRKKLCSNDQAQAKTPEFICVITGANTVERGG